MSGDMPSPALLEKEAKALGLLSEVRAALLAAMADGAARDAAPPADRAR